MADAIWNMIWLGYAKKNPVEPFFITKLELSKGTFRIDLGDETAVKVQVSFDSVRNFMFLKESDFHIEFQKYGLKPLLTAADGGIFRIEAGCLSERLAATLPDYVQQDKPEYYFTATADECLEIACFEEPSIRVLP